jgi:uncharacterized membrane protein YeiB
MYAEILGGYGILIFLFVFIAEVSDKKILGMVGSLLLLLLGAWLIGDPTLQLRTGDTAVLVQNDLYNTSVDTSLAGGSSLNALNNYTTYSENVTGSLNSIGDLNYTRVTSYTYSDINAPVFFSITIGQALAFIFIGLGVYGFAAYAIEQFVPQKR